MHQLSSCQILQLTVTQAQKYLHSGKLTVLRYVKVCFKQIFKLNPKGDLSGINAMIYYNYDAAIKRAKKLDRDFKRGKPLGPLFGIPVLIKDSFDVAGIPTTAATPSLRINIPSTTAPVVQALIDAGAVILGKNNLAEMSLQLTNTNDSFAGTCKNPYNLLYTSGGSSGGGGASIASLFAPLAIGEDTGGSVRNPGTCCGVYAFRPTTHRYSQEGIVPVGSGFDTAGPITRSIKDMILVDNVITKTKIASPVKTCKIRIGVPRRFFYENLTPEVQKGMENALEKLSRSKITLVEVDVDTDLSIAFNDELTLLTGEFTPDLQAYLDKHSQDINNPLPFLTVQDVIDQIATPAVKAFATNLSIPAPPDIIAQARARQIEQQRVFGEYFANNQLDAIFIPASTHVALPLDFGIVESFNIYAPTYTVESFNALPAIAIPIGLTDNGLPVGASLVGPHNSDTTLLQVGVKIEKILN